MGFYYPMENNLWPPLCWIWAWKKLDKNKTTTKAIQYHSKNKENCPYCKTYEKRKLLYGIVK